MPRITEKVSISTTAPLTTITKLAVEHYIELPMVFFGSPAANCCAKRLKHTIGRSPAVKIGRRVYIPAFDYGDELLSPEQQVPQDDDHDDYYVALPDDASSPQPRLTISLICRHQSFASSIVNNDVAAPVDEVEPSQTTSQRAQQQLRDPTAQLTDDVLNLLLQHFTRTSKNPDAKVLDYLYIQVDRQESRQPPAGLTRVCESNKVIYIPLHHQSQGGRWSLALLRPEQACIEHYDSLHSRQREIRIQGCFESMLEVHFVQLSRTAS